MRESGYSRRASSRRRVGADTVCSSTRRRLLLALGASVIGAPLALSQPAKMPRIGFMAHDAGPDKVFAQKLRELGYVEGRNVIVEYRIAGDRHERLPEFAAELVRLNVDVIVAPDPPSYRAAMNATKTIPIVMRASSDPVANGTVASLARPGGNITGVFSLYSDLIGKRMELLKELVPAAMRIAVLLDTGFPDSKRILDLNEKAASALGLTLHPVDVRSAEDIRNAAPAVGRLRPHGLLVLRSPVIHENPEAIAALAAKTRLPAIFEDAQYVDAGGLMSYGANSLELYRLTAVYADKILKGARPSDLPVQQPTTFELVINRKTATALGIKIPNSIMVRADRVIK
jgi:putative ABC transport system substrate-binding protein